MRIIIEGADGTGKSTLVNKLKERYKTDTLHITNLDPNDFEFYKQSLRKSNIIYDRNLLGEMVYPSIFGRSGNLEWYELSYLLSLALENNIKIIVLTASNETLNDRLSRKFEYETVINNINKINGAFIDIAERFEIKILNTDDLNEDELEQAAIAYIEGER